MAGGKKEKRLGDSPTSNDRNFIRAVSRIRRSSFSSNAYWEQRYTGGGNSGSGSYGRLSQFKADVLNAFVELNQVRTVLELGCGDGNQLSLADYPSYVGVDISAAAITLCRSRFGTDATKRFIISGEEELPSCELGISLDVVFHLVEKNVFEKYMMELLAHSTRFVVLYSSDSDVFVPPLHHAVHVLHRPLQRWMSGRSDWMLINRIPNPFPFQEEEPEDTSFSDFYIYEKVSTDFTR